MPKKKRKKVFEGKDSTQKTPTNSTENERKPNGFLEHISALKARKGNLRREDYGY